MNEPPVVRPADDDEKIHFRRVAVQVGIWIAVMAAFAVLAGPFVSRRLTLENRALNGARLRDFGCLVGQYQEPGAPSASQATTILAYTDEWIAALDAQGALTEDLKTYLLVYPTPIRIVPLRFTPLTNPQHARAPAIFESPAINDGQGANIVFVAGHAEFLRYPGYEEVLKHLPELSPAHMEELREFLRLNAPP